MTSAPSKATAGPWAYEADETSSGPMFSVYDVFGRRVTDPHVEEQQARLIAAAHDLLRVAELLVDWLDEEPGAHKLCDTARAAISRATGEA
jgi:hypothetical protein